MSKLLIYLLEVSMISSVLIITYYLAFRKLSFHSFNRWLLLSIPPISLVLPFMNIQLKTPLSNHLTLIELPNLNEAITPELSQATAENSVIEIMGYFEYIYWLGLVVASVIFTFNSLRLFKKIQSSTIRAYSGNIAIYEDDVPTAFSCFRCIIIPKVKTLKRNDPIILHELAHVQLGHSYDLLATQLFVILSWFNPFVILYRNLLRAVHEYQADECVLQSKIKKSDYLGLMLVSLRANNHFNLTSSFKSSMMRDRIEMILKSKSTGTSWTKYFLLLPVAVLILFAFAKQPDAAPSIFPVENTGNHNVVMTFSQNKHGIDISAAKGTEVVATANGKIIKSIYDKGWGNLIIIGHGDGYQTFYAHLNDIVIREGESVSQGQLIGHVGITGNSSNRPHLNYQVSLNGKKVNPEEYFTKN